MSRVAAIIVVGLCFLVGCRETPQQTKPSASYEVFPERQIMPGQNRTPSSDIFIIPDPNDSIALKNWPQEIPSDIKPQIEHHVFAIRPRQNVDYKIIAVKPNPNIDYKILNPMQNNNQRIMVLPERKYEDKSNKPQDNVFLVP
jgi:hypothetical protein